MNRAGRLIVSPDCLGYVDYWRHPEIFIFNIPVEKPFQHVLIFFNCNTGQFLIVYKMPEEFLYYFGGDGCNIVTIVTIDSKPRIENTKFGHIVKICFSAIPFTSDKN